VQKNSGIEGKDYHLITGDLSWKSAELGFKYGLFLSSAYAVSGMIFCILTESDFVSTILFWELAVLFTIVLALLPSSLLGGFSGMLIGLLAEIPYANKIPKFVFSLLSSFLCGTIAVLIHIVFKVQASLDSTKSFMQSDFLDSYLFSYPFLFGVPTIIYILAGGWLGWNIYSKIKSP